MQEDSGASRAALEPPDQRITEERSLDDMPTPAKRTTSPAYQFYPGDFLKDENVLLMSFTEIGVYQVLLCHAWTNRGLPTGTVAIARMLKLSHSRFLKLWTGVLGQCFVQRGDRLVNPRQERERQKQADYRRRQSDNGKQGGRPNRTQPKATQNPPLSSGKARVLKTEDEDEDPHLQVPEKVDVAFRAFQAAYPEARRKGGYVIERAFFDAVCAAVSPQRLMEALANHKASEQWSNPKLIPGMDVWLREERWRQTLPPAGAVASSAANPKTAGNIAALQRFIDRGKAVNE